jgi:hypothetical protein
MGIVLSSKYIEQLDIAPYIVNVMPHPCCQPAVMSARDLRFFRALQSRAEPFEKIEPRPKAT